MDSQEIREGTQGFTKLQEVPEGSIRHKAPEGTRSFHKAAQGIRLNTEKGSAKHKAPEGIGFQKAS